MRIRFGRALAVCLALAWAPSAGAEEPASSAEIAAAHAIADDVLAKSHLGDIFENATETGQPKLRHRASGMTCTARDKPDFKLTIYEGPPRGDDVSCGTDIEDLSETVYAVRNPSAGGAAEIVQGSLASIQRLYTKLEPYHGEYATYPGKHPFTPATVRLEGVLDGEKVFTRSSAVVVGDWVIRQRVTAPLKDATLADVMAEISLQLMLEDMAKARP